MWQEARAAGLCKRVRGVHAAGCVFVHTCMCKGCAAAGPRARAGGYLALGDRDLSVSAKEVASPVGRLSVRGSGGLRVQRNVSQKLCWHKGRTGPHGRPHVFHIAPIGAESRASTQHRSS